MKAHSGDRHPCSHGARRRELVVGWLLTGRWLTCRVWVDRWESCTKRTDKQASKHVAAKE